MSMRCAWCGVCRGLCVVDVFAVYGVTLGMGERFKGDSCNLAHARLRVHYPVSFSHGHMFVVHGQTMPEMHTIARFTYSPICNT